MELNFISYGIFRGSMDQHNCTFRPDWDGHLFTDPSLVTEPLQRPYGKYLLRAIESDFWEHDLHRIDAALEDIAQIERGEIETAGWGNDAFSHLITRKDVTFEHTVFGECEVWPIWSCPLAHYKAALEGWRTFLNMTDDIGTELIIELPD